MVKAALLLGGLLAGVGFPISASSQQEVYTRVQADPDYAVRLLVEELGESIRTGAFDARFATNPALAAAAAGLAEARRGGRTAPRPELGPLWDFRVEVLEITHLSAEQVVVSSNAFFQTDAIPERNTKFELTFQKNAQGYWMLSDADSLVVRLNALRSRGASRRGR